MEKLSIEERDIHNKKVVREGSWMCDIFQENDVPVGIRKRILQELMEDHKQKLREDHGQED